jgi:hypothetical protein
VDCFIPQGFCDCYSRVSAVCLVNRQSAQVPFQLNTDLSRECGFVESFRANCDSGNTCCRSLGKAGCELVSARVEWAGSKGCVAGRRNCCRPGGVGFCRQFGEQRAEVGKAGGNDGEGDSRIKSGLIDSETMTVRGGGWR